MSKWYLDENDSDIYLRDDNGIRWNYSPKELVRILNDLETKLAESEKENRELHTAINLSIPNQIAMKDEIEKLHTCRDKRISELLEEHKQLKQQLAEKEKTIEEVKVYWVYQYERELKSHNRDKISFAVEQLEKVKERMSILPSVPKYNKIHELIDRVTLRELIETQIKAIKEIK